MKNFFFLLIILCSFSSIHSQTWDGDAMDNDWNNPLNWDTDMIPIAGALVEFDQTVSVNAGSGTVLFPPAQIKVRGTGTVLTLDLDITVGDGFTEENAILMNSNAHLVIPDGRTLILNPPMTEYGFNNFPGASNASITIDTLATVNIILAERGISLQNSSFIFTNHGTITIASCDKDGINLGTGATFINNGSLTIGVVDQDGVDNKGNFHNNGSLAIISASKKGINNTATFNNKGLISITDFLLTTDDGIFSNGTFNNDTTGVITISSMLDDGIDALGGVFTNTGALDITVGNSAAIDNPGIAIGSNSVTSTFVNNGIIDVNAGGSSTARAIYVYPGVGGTATFNNNGLITLSNGNPLQRFFTKGRTINGPTGTIDVGDGRINVNLYNFRNNGLIESSLASLPGVFTFTTGTSINDGFFRTNSSSFSNGTGSITNSGIDMNDPAQTTIDLSGSCDVTIGGFGAQQTWLNMLGDSVALGPDLSFENAFSSVVSTVITAFGIDVSLTIEDICAAALPIELTSFTAITKEKSVLLEWETATEIDNDYMAVERSTDAKFFTEIGRKQGAGDSNSAIRYQLEDAAPLNGINYYRLRQVDFDGTTNYSKIISVNFNGTTGTPTIALYPNLVKTGESMEIDLGQYPNQLMNLQLVNSQGQALRTFSLMGGSRQAFEVGNLPAGMYFLLNTNSTSKVSTKFMVID